MISHVPRGRIPVHQYRPNYGRSDLDELATLLGAAYYPGRPS